jgi:hypothetical protein
MALGGWRDDKMCDIYSKTVDLKNGNKRVILSVEKSPGEADFPVQKFCIDYKDDNGMSFFDAFGTYINSSVPPSCQVIGNTWDDIENNIEQALPQLPVGIKDRLRDEILSGVAEIMVEKNISF